MPMNNIKYPTAIISLGFQEPLSAQLENIAKNYNAQVYSVENIDNIQILNAVESISFYACFMLIHSDFLACCDKKFILELGNYLPLILINENKQEEENLEKLNQFKNCFLYNISNIDNLEALEENIANLIYNFQGRAKLLVQYSEEKALENSYLYEKSENVLLREVFNEKSKTYSFLSEFIKNINTSKNIQELFTNTRFELEKIFSLQSMHIAFWKYDFTNIHYYLGIKDNNISTRLEWKKYLTSLVKPIMQKAYSPQETKSDSFYSTDIYYKNSDTLIDEDNFILSPCHVKIMNSYSSYVMQPNSGYICSIPLMSHGIALGSLIIHLTDEPRIGKDLKESLEIACSHLTLMFNEFFQQECKDKESYVNSNKIVYEIPSLRQ